MNIKILLLTITLSLPVCSLFSQTKKDIADPFSPLNKISAGNSFFMDWQEFKDDRFYIVTFIETGLADSEGKLGFELFIPFVTTDVTFETLSGFGDIVISSGYNNSLCAGHKFLFELSLSIPTAARDENGTGKFVAGPGIGVNKYYSWGFSGIIIKDLFSFAGIDNNRSEIHETSLKPLVKIILGKNWYTLITPDIRYNWITQKIFVPYTQEFGKIFNGNFAFAFKSGVHLLNTDKRYDWSAEVKLTYFGL